MNNTTTNTYKFKLRFPEFSNKKTWKPRKLSEVLFEHGNKSTGNEDVYSVSVHKGVINQIEHLGRSFSAANTDHYKLVNPGDVIYTKSPTGDFPYGIIKQSKVPKAVIVSPLYAVFQPETTALGTILDAYFEYRENVINYLSSIIQKGAKNTINIRNDVFLSKSLVLPTDSNEQEKIASCLSSLDDLITAHIQKLDALKAHKKGLMQQLFPAEGEKVPKLRFKEFEGSGEWEEKTLSEVADYENGKAHEQDVVEKGKFVVVNSKFISTEGEVRKYTNNANCLAQKGDILLVLSDVPNGKAIAKCFFVDVDDWYTVNQRVCRITAFDANNLLLFFLLDRNEYFLSFDDGVKQTNLRKDEVLACPLLLPKDPLEQQKIAECLASINDLVYEEIEKIEQLKNHKKGMIQGIFPNLNVENS